MGSAGENSPGPSIAIAAIFALPAHEKVNFGEACMTVYAHKCPKSVPWTHDLKPDFDLFLPLFSPFQSKW